MKYKNYMIISRYIKIIWQNSTSFHDKTLNKLSTYGMYFNIQKDICDKPTGNTISSVQFSRSVMSNYLWPHGLQHTRLPCPSPTPGACSNSCPSSRWCHPTISSSVVVSSCLQSFPASGSFPVSQVTKVLGLQLQYQSFQWIFRTDLL